MSEEIFEDDAEEVEGVQPERVLAMQFALDLVKARNDVRVEATLSIAEEIHQFITIPKDRTIQ